MQSGQPTDESQNSRKPRSRTCLKVMATGEKEKQLVEWNERGQPVGDVSVQFSSTVGVMVREQVSCVIESWHKVDKSDKDRLWKLVQVSLQMFICKTIYCSMICQIYRYAIFAI